MTLRPYILLLCLLAPAALYAEPRTLKGTVVTLGTHDEETPAVGVQVSIKGVGNPSVSVAGGEFRLSLPEVFKPGEPVALMVNFKDYRVLYPAGGQTLVPADSDKQPIDLKLARKGSAKFFSEAQIQSLVEGLARDSTRQIQATKEQMREKPNFAALLKDWADQYGFSEQQVTTAVAQWAKETQEKHQDIYKLGLVAFAQKNFSKASELFTRSGEENEKKLEAARQDTVRDFRLAGDADYNNYRFEDALVSYQRALKPVVREQTPSLWAELQTLIGTAHFNIGVRTEGVAIERQLAEAVTAFRAALQVFTREALPQDWALTQTNLGSMLLEQGRRTAGEAGATLLAEAVTAYRAALQVQTRETLPQQWALTQMNLGLALFGQSERAAGEAGAKLLAEAVTAFRAALQVFTREALPQQWAMTQMNLGLALAGQSERAAGEAGAKLLAEAMTAFRAALQVFTREALPQQWAMTQTGLGDALLKQGRRATGQLSDKLLAESVGVCRDALQVNTRDAIPVEWARTQDVLGSALVEQGRRTKGEAGVRLLTQAIKAHQAALTIYTKEHFPWYWEQTQNHLKQAQAILTER